MVVSVRMLAYVVNFLMMLVGPPSCGKAAATDVGVPLAMVTGKNLKSNVKKVCTCKPLPSELHNSRNHLVH